MKKIIMLLVACLILLSACSTEPVEITNIATYENRQVELLDATYHTTEDGVALIRVCATFTNNDEQGLYILESFATRAYQNGMEINSRFDYFEDDNSTRKVKDGQSLSVAYTFVLTDDSPVTVQVGTPTADEILLAEREYSR